MSQVVPTIGGWSSLLFVIFCVLPTRSESVYLEQREMFPRQVRGEKKESILHIPNIPTHSSAVGQKDVVHDTPLLRRRRPLSMEAESCYRIERVQGTYDFYICVSSCGTVVESQPTTARPEIYTSTSQAMSAHHLPRGIQHKASRHIIAYLVLL